MRKSPGEIYNDTQKEIPIWKQKLKSIENEVDRFDKLVSEHLNYAKLYLDRKIELEKEKKEILKSKKEVLLWKN